MASKEIAMQREFTPIQDTRNDSSDDITSSEIRGGGPPSYRTVVLATEPISFRAEHRSAEIDHGLSRFEEPVDYSEGVYCHQRCDEEDMQLSSGVQEQVDIVGLYGNEDYDDGSLVEESSVPISEPIEETSQVQRDDSIVGVVVQPTTNIQTEGIVVCITATAQLENRGSYIDKDSAAIVLKADPLWANEFPFGEQVMVPVEEQKAVCDHQGRVVMLSYEEVSGAQVNKAVNNVEQLKITNSNPTVAYLLTTANERGYFVHKEFLFGSLQSVSTKFGRTLKRCNEQGHLLQRNGSCHRGQVQRNWPSNEKVLKKLEQLLLAVLNGVFEVIDKHHLNNVAHLNISVDTLFLWGACQCQSLSSCPHDWSQLKVVVKELKGLKVAHQANSLVPCLKLINPEQCIQLIGPMHKYKRAKLEYDLFDASVTVIKIIFEFTGNSRQNLDKWINTLRSSAANPTPDSKVFIEKDTNLLVEEIAAIGYRFGSTIMNEMMGKLVAWIKSSTQEFIHTLWDHEV